MTLAPRSSWGRSGAPVLMSVQPLVNPGPHTQSLRCVFNLWEIVLNMWFCISFYLYDQFNFLRRITMVRFSPSTNTTRDILTVDKDFDECLSLHWWQGWILRYNIWILIFFSCFSEPIMEEEVNTRSLRSWSITHGNEMSFLDFADLFKIFRYIIYCWFVDLENYIILSIRSQKDVRNIFKIHSVCSKKIDQIMSNESTNIPPMDTGSKVKLGMDSQYHFSKIEIFCFPRLNH